MSSIFSKISDLVQGHVNQLLDEAIDMNSIPVVTQQIRRFEDGISQMKNALAIAQGDVVTKTRSHDEIQHTIETLQHNIDLVLMGSSADKKATAVALGQKLIPLQHHVETLSKEVSDAQERVKELDDSVKQLEGRHEELMERLTELKSKSEQARAENLVAKTAQNVKKMTSGVEGSSVDNLLQRAQQNADTAHARLQQAMGDLQEETSVDKAVVNAQAEDYVAKRLAELESKRKSK
ncbi:PspA/IM30 family protein [Candidatus Acetothermia bacterium]|nr:PspA/IM30 family protein [Candidatus Acetothermia bacterium]